MGSGTWAEAVSHKIMAVKLGEMGVLVRHKCRRGRVSRARRARVARMPPEEGTDTRVGGDKRESVD